MKPPFDLICECFILFIIIFNGQCFVLLVLSDLHSQMNLKLHKGCFSITVPYLENSSKTQFLLVWSNILKASIMSQTLFSMLWTIIIKYYYKMQW